MARLSRESTAVAAGKRATKSDFSRGDRRRVELRGDCRAGFGRPGYADRLGDAGSCSGVLPVILSSRDRGPLMSITDVCLHPVSVERSYETQIAQEGGGSRARVARSPFVFIEAQTADGLTGWGEISDVPAAEYPCLDGLRSELRGLLIGVDPFDIQHVHAGLSELYPFAVDQEWPRLVSAAVDMLCYDLQAQRVGVPVFKLLGGAQRTSVPVSWVAFIRDDLQLLKQEIEEKVARGFWAFKLKVGVDLELDDARLEVMRQAAGPEANIKIDPNGGWTLDEAIVNIPRLARHGISGVETPIAFRDPRQLAELRRHVDVPLIEHVFTKEDAVRYIRHESLDWFNLATTGCGGIWPARCIAEMAQAAGVGILLGSTVELGPGTLAQLHLAASIRDLTLPSDLIGPEMYQDDVLDAPLCYASGCLTVPSVPGLGVGMDRTALERLA